MTILVIFSHVVVKYNVKRETLLRFWFHSNSPKNILYHDLNIMNSQLMLKYLSSYLKYILLIYRTTRIFKHIKYIKRLRITPLSKVMTLTWKQNKNTCRLGLLIWNKKLPNLLSELLQVYLQRSYNSMIAFLFFITDITYK